MQDNHCAFCTSLLHVLGAVVAKSDPGRTGAASAAYDDLVQSVRDDDIEGMVANLLRVKRAMLEG